MPKTNSRNRRRRTHHPLVTIVIIVLLIGISLFISKALADRVSDVETEDNKKENPETTKVEGIEKAPTENAPSTTNEDDKTPIQNEGENPNNKDSLTGAITMAEPSGQILRIRLNIDQYLATGTCKLTLYSDNGKSFTDSAAIIPTASTSSCEGFDINLSNLSSGHWYISIDLASDNKTGTITGEVNI